MDCHCTYLEPDFWHDVTPCVLHNKGSLQEAERLEAWLVENERLKSHVFFKTSGTTGQAKWVALSKEALLASARAVIDHLGIVVGVRWGLALPIYHVGGFGVLVRAFLTGGNCAVFHHKWDAVRFTRFVYEESCEHLSLVPTQVSDLVTNRCVCPDSVKSVVVGGGSLSDALYERSKALGWPIFRSYGMTESASQIATGDLSDGFLNVLNHWQVRVNDNGLLEWKGEAGFSGYVKETEDGFEFEDPKENGWFTTQDRVELREGGIKVLGRSDSLVKILGELVDLTQLEKKIKQHTGKECVILTEPDERRGVKLIAVVESEEEVDLNFLSGIDRIERIKLLGVFPRTDLGKVIKNKINGLL